MSETESIEQKTCNQFIEKLKEGNCAGALELLVRKFPGGSGYAGEDLLLFITHNFSLDLVMFQAAHYGCEGTFDEIKNKILAVEDEDGFPHSFSADEIYFVLLDQMANLGDQALAGQIAEGTVPDLWPIPGDPTSFGIPSRTCDIQLNLREVHFGEIKGLTSLKEGTFEVVIKKNAFGSEGQADGPGLNQGNERITPEEFGDRSRDPDSMTLVYNLGDSFAGIPF